MHSLHAAVSPHPNPSPKEKGLIKSEVEVLSFGEDYSRSCLFLKGVHECFAVYVRPIGRLLISNVCTGLIFSI
jgi:hypothetical protein